MIDALSLAFLAAAAVGVVVLALQRWALACHVSEPVRAPRAAPGISILKPLCGVDDSLVENLSVFARLDYPRYEVLLGVRSVRDAAYPVAIEIASRWPSIFRVVVQSGEPGMNPKVNQLITLSAAARHEVVVVSDSNVRVGPGYLSEIAAELEDPRVGLVTHPIAGVGEKRLGSLMDNLQLASNVSPGLVAAKRLAGRDIVVGKSMAFRRADLEALGGFEAVKDVLAEDYVMGLLVPERLGKRVAVARTPVQNVNERRCIGEFLSRYQRWSVLQRQAVGPIVYVSQVFLNPVFLAFFGVVLAPDRAKLVALAVVSLAKIGIDSANGRMLRGNAFALRQLLWIPAKDLVFGLAWLHGLVSNEVTWRGNRLRVMPGTRLAGADEAAPAPEAEPAPY